MFHICAIFHQMISLNDTTLKWGFDIFCVEKISRCVDTGFESILCKCNRGLITFFFFSWHFWYQIFWYFYEVLNFLGTSFLVSGFEWYFIFWRSFFISAFLRYLNDFPNALFPFFVCSGFQIFLFAIISYWFALIVISLFNCLLFFFLDCCYFFWLANLSPALLTIASFLVHI